MRRMYSLGALDLYALATTAYTIAPRGAEL